MIIAQKGQTDPGPTMTVLVVEDEVLIRLDLAERLRAEGYSVIEASTGDEALSVMNTVSTVVLVISDVRMPGQTDGVGLAALVKQRSPSIKVVLISGHLPSLTMSAVADVALTKPINPALLVRHVKTLLGKMTD
jgi:two-component system, response regulator PdtaR